MMGTIDVWIIHKEKRVLVDDEPGVPVAVTAVVDPDDYAKKGATVSNIGFQKDDHKSFNDWESARKFANEKAAELGYEVDVHSIFEPWADFSDDPCFDSEDGVWHYLDENDELNDEEDVEDYWGEDE